MQKLIDDILARVRDPQFRTYATDLLFEICSIDTTPFPEIERMRAAEAAVFDILERELARVDLPGSRRERRPVNPGISEHPAYSQLHFTKTDDNPEGLPPETVYADRCNLLYFVPGPDGKEGPDGVAVNAHIDVVKPYMPPRLEGNTIYGRGTCDDKGAIVAMLCAFRLLGEVLSAHDKQLQRNLLGMFVVEEETGGNGSLSLAIDRDLKRLYDSIMVLECTSNDIHPANRGALWYRAELAGQDLNLFEMSTFIIEQLEQEGRAIKAESRHSLFPQRPVQTCHGMIGHYGEHPSRICGDVTFGIELGVKADERVTLCVTDCIASALAEYTAVYGDKTQIIDSTTGKPKVERHYDLTPTETGFLCRVYGSTGHMGSILENDGAITKMAAFVRALFRSRNKIARLAGGTCTMSLTGDEKAETLVLEGGQGFVPTHDITEIMERVRRAAQHGADNYLRLLGRSERGDEAVEVTYDKLHNAAFDGDPDSVPMRHAVAAAKAVGMWRNQEIMGWTVSCDSRLFATEYPDMPVITSGAGHLKHAHSDEEQLALDELMTSISFLASYILLQAGID